MYHSFASWTRGSAKGEARMRRSMLAAFLIIEALLYGSFLFLDLQTDVDTTWLKFVSILIIAVMSMLAKNKVFTAALCLTAAADVFLLVLNRWYILGIFIFIVVQLLYSISLDSRKTFYCQLILIFASVTLLLITQNIDALAIGYIMVFLINLLRAGLQYWQKRDKQALLFFSGLLLFFCCDLCVGYYQIGSGSLWHFARIAMWGFYLPGQILILLSDLLFQGDHI